MLLFVVFFLLFSVTALGLDPVVLYHPQNLNTPIGREGVGGIEAALLEANRQGGLLNSNSSNSRPFLLVVYDHGNLFTPTLPVLAAAANATVVLSSDMMATFPFVPVANNTATAIPLIAPSPMDARAWQTRSIINKSPPFHGEAITLLKYALNSHLRCKFFMVPYSIADREVLNIAMVVQNTLLRLGFPLAHLVPYPNEANTTEWTIFMANVTSIMYEKLQVPPCILMMSFFTEKFVDAMTSDPRFRKHQQWVLAPSIILDTMLSPLIASLVKINFILSASIPHPKDVRHKVVREYQAAMLALQANASNSTPQSFSFNFLSFSRYLETRLAITILRRTPSNLTGPAIINAVFDSPVVKISDFSYGPYTDGCHGMEDTTVAPCFCTAGARKYWINQWNAQSREPDLVVDDVTISEKDVTQTTIPPSDCFLSPEKLQRPNIYLFLMAGNVTMEKISLFYPHMMVMYAGFALAAGFGRLMNGPLQGLNLINLTDTNFTHDSAMAISTRYNIRAVLFPTVSDPDEIFAGVGRPLIPYMAIGPIRYEWALKDRPLQPNHLWNPYYVPLWPTLADYIHTVADYYAQQPQGTNLPLYIFSDRLDALELAVKSFHTFQKDPTNRYLVAPEEAKTVLLSTIPAPSTADTTATSAAMVVIISQNITFLSAALEAARTFSNQTQFYLVSSEHVIDTIVTAGGGANLTLAAKNVNFCSAVAAWDPYGFGLLSVAGSYSIVVGASLAMEANNGIFQNDYEVGTAWHYISALYSSKSFSAFGAAHIGPFDNTPCGHTAPVEEHPEGTCQCTKGFTQFFLRNLTNWFNPQAMPFHSHTLRNCGVRYSPLIVPTDLTQELIGSGVVLGLLITGLTSILIYFCCRGGARDVANAPKDMGEKFTIVFTDIQSSTMLWAKSAAEMSEAIELHHSTIRDLVREYQGFEVKTIGDSFMVAFKSPTKAVAFSVAIQRSLHSADWKTRIFDTLYIEKALEDEARAKAEEDPTSPALPSPAAAAVDQHTPKESAAEVKYVVTSPEGTTTKPNFSTAPVYDELWCGLRVRVGVNTSFGTINSDPVTQSYDYYGTVVNTAARVEGVGHGGQVLITQETLDEIEKENKSFSSFSSSAAASTQPTEQQTPASFPIPNTVIKSLGPQPLRGIPHPVVLHQLLPAEFAGRTFPPLRLDVEISVGEDDEDDEGDNAGDGGVASGRSRASSVAVNQQIDFKSSAEFISFLCRTQKGAKRQDDAISKWYLHFFDYTKTLLSTTTAKATKELLDDLVKKWRVQLRPDGQSLRNFKKGLSDADYRLGLIIMKCVAAYDANDKKNVDLTVLAPGTALSFVGNQEPRSGPSFSRHGTFSREGNEGLLLLATTSSTGPLGKTTSAPLGAILSTESC